MRSVTLIPLTRPKGRVRIQLGERIGVWENRANRLIDALGGVYTSKGYHLSKKRAELFVKLYGNGWGVRKSFNFNPNGTWVFTCNEKEYTLNQAKNIVDAPSVGDLCYALERMSA